MDPNTPKTNAMCVAHAEKIERLEAEVKERRKDAKKHAEQVSDLVELARKNGATEAEIQAIRNPI